MKINNSKIKKYIVPLLILAAAVIILELIVFNFRHWMTIANNPAVVDGFAMSDNISWIDNNAFRVDNTETRPYIEVTDLDMPVNLLYLDFINIDKGEYGVLEINYTIELTDQGNSIPYELPQRTFFRWVTKTHYAPVNPYGNAHSIRVYFDNLNEGDMIRVCAFIINPTYMLQLSKKRMAVMFLILLALYLIRPASSLYELTVDAKFKGKYIAILFVLILELLLIRKAVYLNKWFDNVPEGGCTQFMQLAEAIVDRGEVFLAAKPPEGMAEMEDPYDAVLRRALYGENSDVGDMSDTGFYKGRYFVYFGVAPILIFYVPVYALTGAHIATRTVVLILYSLNAMAVMLLLYQMCMRFFRKMPFVMYLMASVLFTFGAGQLFLSTSPDFYSVPIHFALTCILFGLFCWIRALNILDEDFGAEKIKTINVKVTLLYALGSFLMALTAASRPQFLIASFLAIILFWREVFSERRMFSKTSIGKTLAFVLPYVFIAAGVMYYNYIRFGNVFDFGANYNLCYNNMPYRGVHIDRLLHATIGYLFYPCTVTNRFPFFELSSYISRYPGVSADENLFGGIIYNNLYLIIVFFVFKLRKYIDRKDAFLVAAIAPVFSVIVAVVDANMAGVLPRYYADFTWGFMISAFILLGYLYTTGGIASGEELKTEVVAYRMQSMRSIIKILFVVLFVWSCIRYFLMMFYGESVHNNNMMTYNIIKNLVEFWY